MQCENKGRYLLFYACFICSLALIFIGSWLGYYKYFTMPHEMKVLLPGDWLLNGTNASIKVILVDRKNNAPISGAQIVATLADRDKRIVARSSTRSDKKGSSYLNLYIPDMARGEHLLRVTSQVHFAHGESSMERKIEVRSSGKIYLSTDKPFYQPGQTIHLRAVLLSGYNLQPIPDKKLLFEIEDSASTKVFRRGITTSPYGIAATTFNLAREIRHGTYVIRAMEGATQEQITIEVKKYHLPRFKPVLTTDKTYIMPGENLSGEIRARYSFGKPVAKAPVELEFALLDQGRLQKLYTLRSQLDDEGRHLFTTKIPVVELDSDVGAWLLIRAKVYGPDKNFVETASSLALSSRRILLDVVPETGHLVPGLENVLYLLVAQPDGTPLANAEIFIDRQKYVSDTLGIASCQVRAAGKMNLTATVVSGRIRETYKLSLMSHAQAKYGALARMQVFALPIDSKLRIITVNKDGSPLYTKIGIPELNLATDKFASVHEFTNVDIEDAQTLTIKFTDHYGNKRTVNQSLDPEQQIRDSNDVIDSIYDSYEPRLDDNIAFIVRTDKGIYRKGETVHVTIISTLKDSSFFFDVCKNGQVVASRPLYLPHNARTEHSFIPSTQGTLELFAYHVTGYGKSYGIGKTIYVANEPNLAVTVEADRDIYRPGDEANLTFSVTDKNGNPRPGVIGVTVVDESVFWLGNNADPYHERLFFTLDRQLLSQHLLPRVLPGGYDLPRALHAVMSGDKRLATVSKVLMAKSSPPLHTNSAKGTLPGRFSRIIAAVNKLAKLLVPWAILVWTLLIFAARGRKNHDAEWQNHFNNIMGYSISISVFNALIGPALLLFFGRAAFFVWLPVAIYFTMRQLFSIVAPVKGTKGIAVLCMSYQLTILLICSVQLLSTNSFSPFALWSSLIAVLLMPLLLWQLRNRILRHERFYLYKKYDNALRCYVAIAKLALQLGIALVVAALLFAAAWLFFFIGPQIGFAALAVFFIITALFIHKVFPEQGLRGKHPLGVLFVLMFILLIIAAMLLPTLSSVQEKGKRASFRSTFQALEKEIQYQESERGKPKLDDLSQQQTAMGEKPNIRSFFPETLHVNPALITDDSGRATITLPLADSITSWRATAFAHTMQGDLAKTNRGIRVFQPFFVEAKCPLQLTQGDAIAIPVTVYNYCERDSQVNVTCTVSSGLELVGPAHAELTVAAQNASVVNFHVQASTFGKKTLTVRATCAEDTDIVRYDFEVEPYGQKITRIQNLNLQGKLHASMHLPRETIPGSGSLSLRLYDSPAAEIIGGMEGLLTRPYG